MTACARCTTSFADGDLRCAVCGLASPTTRALVAREAARVLRCSECGAAVSYVAEAQAPKCMFCAAVMRVEQPVDPIDQASALVPFAVSREEAGGMLRAWLRTLGFFRPSDLSKRASVEALVPLFWAGWLVRARALVSWTGDSDAGSRRSSWAPHAGQTVLGFERLLVSASRGLRHDECARLAHGYDISRAVSVAEHVGPPGSIVEQFDAQRSAARRTVADAIARTAEAQLVRGHIPGSRFRNVHVTTLLQGLETDRLALPVWVVAYRYKDRVYRAIVHGQDARCVIGDAPISYAKIALVIAGVIAALVLVLAIAIAALSR